MGSPIYSHAHLKSSHPVQGDKPEEKASVGKAFSRKFRTHSSSHHSLSSYNWNWSKIAKAVAVIACSILSSFPLLMANQEVILTDGITQNFASTNEPLAQKCPEYDWQSIKQKQNNNKLFQYPRNAQDFNEMAIRDAYEAESGEDEPLLPLPHGENITVVTWASKTKRGFENCIEKGNIVSCDKINSTCSTPIPPCFANINQDYPVWVTLPEEMQQNCQGWGLSGERLNSRIKEFLGLNPTLSTSNRVFVVLEVPKEILKRPCFSVSQSKNGEICPWNGTSILNTQDKFRNFLCKHSFNSYSLGSENSCPFTALGYTFDLNPYAKSDYGATEFLIFPSDKKIDIPVLGTFSTDEFCASTSHDVVIIGGGVAGLTAAKELGSATSRPLVITGPTIGGTLTRVFQVKNWPHSNNVILGRDIGYELCTDATNNHAILQYENVTSVDFSSCPFRINTISLITNTTHIKKSYLVKTCIIATGATPDIPVIDGLNDYFGLGVYDSERCVDPASLKDQEVAVYGGADSAVSQTEKLLNNSVAKVHIIMRRLATPEFLNNTIFNNTNVQLHDETQIMKVDGDGQQLTTLSIQSNGTNSTMDLKMLFLATGKYPNSEIFRKYLTINNGTQNNGTIQTYNGMTTQIEGIYVIGNVRKVSNASKAIWDAEEAVDQIRASKGRC